MYVGSWDNVIHYVLKKRRKEKLLMIEKDK